jgi:hypothetical protein
MVGERKGWITEVVCLKYQLLRWCGTVKKRKCGMAVEFDVHNEEEREREVESIRSLSSAS